MAVVLDSSILIGFLYADDAHHARCRAVLQSADVVEAQWVVPASACAEVLVGAYRGPLDVARSIERFFEEGVERVEPLTRGIATAAARIRSGFAGLSLADAFVLATGLVVDADEILTADRAWARVDARVRVI